MEARPPVFSHCDIRAGEQGNLMFFVMCLRFYHQIIDVIAIHVWIFTK